MNATAQLMGELLAAEGPSGRESEVVKILEPMWRALANRVERSRLGSLHALKRGEGREPRPSLMMAAHIDSIGMMVSGNVGGLLTVSPIGSVNPYVLPGLPVIVHGRREVPGVVTLRPSPPGAVPKQAVAGTAPRIFVDTGLASQQVSRFIRVGDIVSIDLPPVGLESGHMSGRALDNRAGIAALTLCLEQLSTERHSWDVWAVATTQEETTYGGAATSAYALRPDLALAVDTTFGKGAGADGWHYFEVGGGPTLCVGPNMHPGLHARFRQVAEAQQIPHSIEPVPASSESDAMALQVTGDGMPTMLLCIPVRNMHTAVEVVALRDVEETARLLTAFVVSLEPDFLSRMAWDT